ncbi:MAG: DAK2 domain-containing protein [Chloroflexi bacterium]|nr:DAK2 domain-containing protein [Chloroflexota bacterium]
MSAKNQDRRRVTRKQILQQMPMDGQAVKNLAIAGLAWLETNKETVNALNVFPVPDGDTGTNMVLTMQSAIEEIESSGERHTGKMLAAVAQGALMGARGNSGVILSQLWRGFARALSEDEALTAEGLVSAFAEARDTAYKGVVKPVEGTILTVAKDVAAATESAFEGTQSTVDILEIAVAAAEESVEHTPELLPILKEAGVVDSGGMGFFMLLEGMLRWIYGQPLDTAPAMTVQPLSLLDLETSLDAMEEGQDFEVVVDFKPDSPLDLEKFYGDLEEMGTSIQVGEGEGMYRMHIHVPTEKRYEPIDYTMTLGTVTNVAIENLMAQMEALEGDAIGHLPDLVEVKPDQIAVISVVPGPGIARVFASLGVAALIEGGQTMNPSTQQILKSFEDLPTNNIIILPNNKNIVMAAEAAAEVTVKAVHVIKSLTIPQGLAAMLRLVSDGDLEKVVKGMTAAMSEVETGEITTATRDVQIDGVDVKEGQIIALHNGELILSRDDLLSGCMEFLEKIGAEEYELITLFYGANVQKKQVEEVTASIQAAYPDHEVDVQEGGQHHYQFIFSIE